MAKIPKTSGLTNKHFYLTVLEDEEFEIKVLADPVS